jgi:large subunit ribosomal protein L15
MQQHELRPPKGATHKRKRVGRGNASGHGTYATKGLKGQKARAGGGVRPGFEGGQLPLVRRMAYKRGFTNPFRTDYEEVNVGALSRFEAGAEVNVDALKSARLVRTGRPVKILGNGDLAVKLMVEAHSFSKSAREKIEAAGGSVRWIGGEPKPKAVAAADAPESAESSENPPDEGKRAAKRARGGAAAKTSEEATTPEAGEEASDGAGSE